jgi:hypothetical protein
MGWLFNDDYDRAFANLTTELKALEFDKFDKNFSHSLPACCRELEKQFRRDGWQATLDLKLAIFYCVTARRLGQFEMNLNLNARQIEQSEGASANMLATLDLAWAVRAETKDCVRMAAVHAQNLPLPVKHGIASTLDQFAHALSSELVSYQLFDFAFRTKKSWSSWTWRDWVPGGEAWPN